MIEVAQEKEEILFMKDEESDGKSWYELKNSEVERSSEMNGRTLIKNEFRIKSEDRQRWSEHED